MQVHRFYFKKAVSTSVMHETVLKETNAVTTETSVKGIRTRTATMNGGIIEPSIQREAIGKANLLPFHTSKSGWGSFSFNRKAGGIIFGEWEKL